MNDPIPTIDELDPLDPDDDPDGPPLRTVAGSPPPQSLRDLAYAAWRELRSAGGAEWDSATDEERIAFAVGRIVQTAGLAESLARAGYTGPGAAGRYLADQMAGRADEVPPATAATVTRHGRIDASELLALDLPPLRWVVPDLIPEGTTVLAAPPKVGKSCLVYQAAVEAAVGGDLLGRRVTPGSVLYLALEDGRRRGQDRLRAALAGRTMPAGRLEVQWDAPKIGEGLEDEVSEWLDGHPDACMVAIDTLGKVRAQGDGRRNAYEVDVAALARLQDIFRDRPVALVIVHHARKEAADDFLASVSGTYGITGSADTIVVVRRKRLEAFGTLMVTGRDVPDAEVAIRFDGLTWHSAPGALPEASAQRSEVYRVIQAEGPIWPKAIGDRTGLERSNAAHIVDRLVQSGAVARTTTGYVAAESLLSLPSHPSHLMSDDSDGGHARAGEGDPACFRDPDRYRTHQGEHYRLGDGWGCRSCEGRP